MRKAGDGDVLWRVSVWAESRPQSTVLEFFRHKDAVRRKNHHIGFRLYGASTH